MSHDLTHNWSSSTRSDCCDECVSRGFRCAQRCWLFSLINHHQTLHWAPRIRTCLTLTKLQTRSWLRGPVFKVSGFSDNLLIILIHTWIRSVLCTRDLSLVKIIPTHNTRTFQRTIYQRPMIEQRTEHVQEHHLFNSYSALCYRMTDRVHTRNNGTILHLISR